MSAALTAPSHGRIWTPTSKTWFPWSFPWADVDPTSKTWFPESFPWADIDPHVKDIVPLVFPMDGHRPPRRRYGFMGPSHERTSTSHVEDMVPLVFPMDGHRSPPISKTWFPGPFPWADIDPPRRRCGSLGPYRGRTSIPSHVEDTVPLVLPMDGHRSPPTSKTWFRGSFPWTDIDPHVEYMVSMGLPTGGY